VEEGLREITKTSFSIVGLSAEIRTCDLTRYDKNKAK
jgi:hypothetical protein